MTAYLELIASNRLEVALETKNLKDQNQFGFCEAKGRHDLIARLIAEIAKHRVRVGREHSDKATAPHNLSTIIGLDVKGAFDNVSQVSIIGKLYHELNDNPIRHWIRTFMLNRRIRIKLGKLKSKSVTLNKGVPQGSALGPILWNYSISDIRQSTRADCLGISLMAYADDLTVISHGSNNYPFVQRTLNRIDRYLRERGLEISTEKSELMHILGPGRRPKANTLPSYHINGGTITPRDQIKILGVTITDQLLLKTENEDTVARLDKAIKLLRHLSISRLVTGSQEWSTRFEAFLKSLLAHDFIPLLAIDGKARVATGLTRTLIRGSCMRWSCQDTCLRTFYDTLLTLRRVMKRLLSN